MGYINFFPFFLGGIDLADSKFEAVFRKLIAPETGLWTDFGIRSLSKFDPYYRKADNYWTSPIWMNMNYLIVSALHGFKLNGAVSEPLKSDIASAYESLRMNLVDMVVKSYTSTGYIWEVFNDESGEGMDNHPFTGWTALVTNLMSEKF